MGELVTAKISVCVCGVGGVGGFGGDDDDGVKS